MASSENKGEPSPFVVKLRGLPYEVTKAQIIKFLMDVNVHGNEKGIHLMISPADGKMTGEAYIELSAQEDIAKALKCDRQNIERRYIEVFELETETEFADAMERQKSIQRDHETILRLRGLPYEVTNDEIKTFFEGIQIKSRKNNNPEIKFLKDHSGKKNGEAFVYFENPEETKKALEKNRDRIGKRYIEIFRATPLEVDREVNKTGYPSTGLYLDKSGVYRGGGNNRAMRDRPYPMNDGFGMRGGGYRNGGNNNWGGNSGNFGNGNGNGYGRNNNSGGFNNFFNDGPNFDGPMNSSMNFNNFDNGGPNNSYCNNDDGAFRIHMRGLPFVSDEVDVREFFAPLKPLDVEIIYDDRRRHAGEANVFFATIEEIDEAMKKHKEMMGSRWIELFFKGFVTGSNNFNATPSDGSGFGRNTMRNNRF